MESWEMSASVQKPTGGVDLSLSSFALGWGSGHRSPLMSEITPSSRKAGALAFQYLGATLADESSWGEWSLAAAAAYSPTPWFSAGLRASFAGGGSGDGLDEGRAVALSGGIRAVVLDPRLELGWLAEDLLHQYSNSQGPDQQRAVTQSAALAARLRPYLSAELQLRWQAGQLERYALGAEWTPWAQRLFLRGGLLYFNPVESRLSPSLGFGIQHRGFRLDYGFRFDAEEGPGSVHRLSLHWSRERS
jgi:hypothetical protein